MAKNTVNAALVSLLIFLLGGYICFASEVEWQDIGRGILDVKSVLVNPDNPNIIYIGTSAGVFKTENAGEIWRNILSIKGQDRRVNFLLFDPQDKNSLYAATGNGLFYSSNQGKNWSRIFKGKNYFENECVTLAVLPYGIYLGTKAGLFVSKDRGRSWHKETTELGNSHILAIAYNSKELNYIYIACINGVFKSADSGQSWERIFITHAVEDGNDEEEVTEDQDEAERFSNLRYISIDTNNANYLYLGTSSGLYKSQDRGQAWEAVSNYGLLSQDIKFLLAADKSHLYAVTKSGIFEYKGERWQELSLGLAVTDIRFLVSDSRDNLYAACDKGLFKANLIASSNDAQDKVISIYFQNEPKINEVQQAAIKYAEVEPEKIMRWRKQAAKKAWLPKITIDMDRDMDRTVSNSIWGTAGTNSYEGKYFVGPDDLTKYNNKNWGVSLTWDLGELIWNDDQTNIDVRSKLMVQLRDDVLDEVTKLYFERIRVKMEIDNLSIEDRKKRFEKELKLQELTAQLDGLTGGYFSKKLVN